MNRNNFLVAWVRLSAGGFMIPGTLQTRPRSAGKPADGKWIQLTPLSTCCGTDPCIITFRNTTANTNITGVESADGSISWTGSVANAGYKSFVIPNCYDMSFTVTMSAPGGTITVTASTVQGSGVIAANPTSILTSVNPVTTVITTTAVPSSEYLVVIS